jgi:hypothetical protein
LTLVLFLVAPAVALALSLRPLPACLSDAAARGLLITIPAACTRREVVLLGAVHLGNASARDSRELISCTRPATVVLELSPSRIETIRARLQQPSDAAAPSPPHSPVAWALVLSLARLGWAAGGLGGVGVACVMAREALERERTRERDLSREDAFAAAVAAADAVGAEVVAADLELHELIKAICHNMDPISWTRLLAAELRGDAARDPIKRGHFNADETLIDWADRRRNVSLAR